MKMWEDDTIVDTLDVVEGATKAIKPETINLCRNLWPEHDCEFSGSTADPTKDIMREIIFSS